MQRGEVRLVDLNPVCGNEGNKRRPAVLVSDDQANATAARLGRSVVSVGVLAPGSRARHRHPERVVELVTAIAAGMLDQCHGCFLRAGRDDLDILRSVTPEDAARRLRLQPYGDEDPLA
jgi:hypothetical protein